MVYSLCVVLSCCEVGATDVVVPAVVVVADAGSVAKDKTMMIIKAVVCRDTSVDMNI